VVSESFIVDSLPSAIERVGRENEARKPRAMSSNELVSVIWLQERFVFDDLVYVFNSRQS